MSGKVLVFGGESRDTLAVVRSLGRKGIRVHLSWYAPNSVVPFSKYVTKTHKLPEYREDESCWLNSLINLLEREKYDLVIPTGDSAMLPLIQERPVLEKIAKLALPSNRAFYCAFRKNEANKLAESLGIPIPRQVLISNQQDLAKIGSDWKFPLVIKPVSSRVISQEEIARLYVSYANSKAELFNKLKNMLQITPVLLQEYFAGVGMGVEVIAEGGKIIYAFQHVRVHEPIHGGGGTYRKSVSLDPKLLACVEKLISTLKWTGVAMVEFKYNKSTNEFVFIEINGRFWGSLPLSIAAGADFPYYLYQLLVEGKKRFSGKYKTGIYCRNLYFDLAWFRRNLFTRPSKFNNAIPNWKLPFELFTLIFLRERSDTFVHDDLRPAFTEIWRLWIRVWLAFRKRFNKVVCSTKLFKNYHLKKLRVAGRGNSIIFVCKGNICRSPFAECYLKNLIRNSGHKLRIESYGYFPQSNRRCSHNAIEAAKQLGVDLTQHHSKVVSEETLSQFDLIVVFDVQNYTWICQSFKKLKRNVLYLGAVSNKDRIEFVPDPYGKDREYFATTYKSIAGMIDMFVRMTSNVTS
ncbi:ATP-grasp domain-containing protein [Candidatus Pacearchaeota archaeon]|nr:ATP-grasp domain-containing protein [Candidatus Pacearchaeota archaeon]